MASVENFTTTSVSDRYGCSGRADTCLSPVTLVVEFCIAIKVLSNDLARLSSIVQTLF